MKKKDWWLTMGFGDMAPGTATPEQAEKAYAAIRRHYELLEILEEMRIASP